MAYVLSDDLLQKTPILTINTVQSGLLTQLLHIPSFPDIEVAVPDPSPRSRTSRRDADPLFSELIPESHPPWVQQAGVIPVGASDTTPLHPPAPGTALDPATDPFLSM